MFYPRDDAIVVVGGDAMIDGLKVTMTGQELRALLERRIESHKRSADRWKSELARTPEEQTGG